MHYTLQDPAPFLTDAEASDTSSPLASPPTHPRTEDEIEERLPAGHTRNQDHVTADSGLGNADGSLSAVLSDHHEIPTLVEEERMSSGTDEGEDGTSGYNSMLVDKPN